MTDVVAYYGGRGDLHMYKGKEIDFRIEVLNEDGSAHDLSDFSEIVLKVFQKIHGTLLYEFDLTEGLELSPNNVINYSPDIDERPKFYYHECYGLEEGSPAREKLIFHGVTQII